MMRSITGAVQPRPPRVDTTEPADPTCQDLDSEPPDDKHWRWVAAVAGIVLLTAVFATMVILNGGDSATKAGKVLPPIAPPAITPHSPATSRSPTTFPSPPATARPTSTPPTTSTPSPTTTSSPAPPSSSASTTADNAPAVNPRTVVYTVTGTRPALDLVTVIYSDERGAFRTEFNVSLPWSKTVVLSPNVVIDSVTATSFASHLNCTITDAGGVTVASQNHNTASATCNR